MVEGLPGGARWIPGARIINACVYLSLGLCVAISIAMGFVDLHPHVAYLKARRIWLSLANVAFFSRANQVLVLLRNSVAGLPSEATVPALVALEAETPNAVWQIHLPSLIANWTSLAYIYLAIAVYAPVCFTCR